MRVSGPPTQVVDYWVLPGGAGVSPALLTEARVISQVLGGFMFILPIIENWTFLDKKFKLAELEEGVPVRAQLRLRTVFQYHHCYAMHTDTVHIHHWDNKWKNHVTIQIIRVENVAFRYTPGPIFCNFTDRNWPSENCIPWRGIFRWNSEITFK